MEQYESDRQELIGILESVKRNIRFLSQTVGGLCLFSIIQWMMLGGCLFMYLWLFCTCL